MKLTLATVAAHPSSLTSTFVSDGMACLIRPLEHSDQSNLEKFLRTLSDQTKIFYIGIQPAAVIASEHVHAIGRYDKLRLVVETNEASHLVGLIEFSFDFTQGDYDRYKRYDIKLIPDKECRFGLCLGDHYQSKGLGTALFPYVVEVAKKFGRSRIMLWGGVHSDNFQAIKYYQKNGFQLVGEFINQDGKRCLDMIRAQ